MNQEIKDTLAELTRQADRLEKYICDSYRGCVVTPSDNELLTAQRYRALVRHIEDLHKTLGDVTTRFEDMAKSFGGCDHSVGICMCDELHAIEKAHKLLNP